MTAVVQNALKDPKFFTGGNAIFTASNGKGEHYTYRIRRPKPDMPFFVQLLTGPDNTQDYTYLGVFLPTGSRSSLVQYLQLTAKSKLRRESKPVQVFEWAVKSVSLKLAIPDGYAIQHEGKCCRCGRRLTVPESIEYGIGPECKKFFDGAII